ncbi:hypothetical protein GCM10010521_50370 [Streptomyces rameus]|uniref:Uncharacterized protein n=1 Tax=Streptomyces rameus TaxID=68261 RepID=A0ABP6NRP2_9ACTN
MRVAQIDVEHMDTGRAARNLDVTPLVDTPDATRTASPASAPAGAASDKGSTGPEWHRLVYRPHVEGPHVRPVERTAVQHLGWLLGEGRVTEVADGRFRAT